MRKGRNEDERSRDKFRTEQGQQMMEKDVTSTDRVEKVNCVNGESIAPKW